MQCYNITSMPLRPKTNGEFKLTPNETEVLALRRLRGG